MWHRRPSLYWRHNDQCSVSNHQPHDCLLNRLFRRKSKKTSKRRVTGLCAGNSPVPVNSPHKGPVTRKMVPFDDVIMMVNIVSNNGLCIYSTKHYPNHLTYWGRATHICVSKLTIIVQITMADKVQSHYLNKCWDIVNWNLTNKRQWKLNEIHTFLFKKMHVKMSYAKWRKCGPASIVLKLIVNRAQRNTVQCDFNFFFSFNFTLFKLL